MRRQLALQVWEGAVPQARRRLQVGPPLRLLDLVADLLNLLLGLPDRGDPPLLLLPLLAQAAAALFQLGNLLLQRREPFPARGVIFLPQGLALDLQLHHPPVDLIELGRLAVNLHPQPAGRLVDQVDRLVGEVPVTDVPVRQCRRGDHGGVGDAHPVVHLVALLQPAQDGDRFLHGRLIDIHGLEPPLQRRVLLDVLAVLVQRGRADGAQFAARQHGLEHVRGIDRAFRGAGADHGVQLVDEQDDLAVAVGDLAQDGPQAIFKLAPVFCPGHQRPEVQLHHALVLQAFGHVPAHNALRQPLHDGRLPDAGIADQDRVVLSAAGEHLDDAPDLIVAADHRIKFARGRQPGQVAAVALQRLIFALGIGVGHPLRSAHFLDRAVEAVRGDAGVSQRPRGRTAASRRDPQQQVFRADVLVVQPLGFGLRGLECLPQTRADH